MKLRKHGHSTPPQISKHEVVHSSETTRSDAYVHPWYTYQENGCLRKSDQATPILMKPNPPTQEQIYKAKFVDKTYQWPKKK